MAKRPAKPRPIEPFLWALFAAGGMLAAMLIPALLLLFGLAFPLGWLTPPDYAHLLAVLRHPITRLVLLALCVLALFHWAHRFRYSLYDGLQLKRHGELISLFCYGGAVVGSFLAAGFLLRHF
jgi:fumarate reductase subunit D